MTMSATKSKDNKAKSIDGTDLQSRIELQYEIEQFYYNESATLDDRRFGDWLGLLTDDIHYWMPIRRTCNENEVDQEFTSPGAMAYFDDDRAVLEFRVKRLDTGYAWAELPPSRTRHLITNVRVLEIDGDEITIESNFHLYRSRLDTEEDSWFGKRRDILRRVDGELKIAQRHIFLDQTVILSTNLSSLF
jgi:biphenyl 2,3-dioxygenase beta subunit